MGWLNTVDLLVLTSFYKLLLNIQILYTFFNTRYLNEEVNRSEPFPSVGVPWNNP
jgi:hypothetical protein